MYSIERNVQILVYLLKVNNIKNIVLSPGTANICFAMSVQDDSFFNIYSASDERSAAYMACGIAMETKQAVVISCTGATASRNYLPALTEAYYRRLPILMISSTLSRSKIGHLRPQQIDRTQLPKDAVCLSVYAKWIKDEEDEWACNIDINKAINTLISRQEPVHIDLETRVSKGLQETLPTTRQIKLYQYYDVLPSIEFSKILIFIGAHHVWTEEEAKALGDFCNTYSALIIADHTANCNLLNGYTLSLEAFQRYQHSNKFEADLLIDIASISGDYYIVSKIKAKKVWRIDALGKFSDRFSVLDAVFQMREIDFFKHYSKTDSSVFEQKINSYVLPKLPFSNIWIAEHLSPILPKNSVLHLAILNSLRSWNFIHIDQSIAVYSNVGGFGIDGCMSTAIGAALAGPEKQHFLVIGDLAFFYDMNSLGNRHLPNNLHILLINNYLGVEFTIYTNPSVNIAPRNRDYIAADGHFSNKNKELVKAYAEALGLDYYRAENKADFMNIRDAFVKNSSRASICECFVKSDDESEALKSLSQLEEADFKDKSKDIIRKTFGDSAVKAIAKLINK